MASHTRTTLHHRTRMHHGEWSESNEEQFYFSTVVWVAIFFSLLSLFHVLKEKPLNGHVPSRYIPSSAVRLLGKTNAFSGIPSRSHWAGSLPDLPLPCRLIAFQQQKLCASDSKQTLGHFYTEAVRMCITVLCL